MHVCWGRGVWGSDTEQAGNIRRMFYINILGKFDCTSRDKKACI